MANCLRDVWRDTDEFGYIRRVSFAIPQVKNIRAKPRFGQELQDGVENLVQVQRPGDGRTDLM